MAMIFAQTGTNSSVVSQAEAASCSGRSTTANGSGLIECTVGGTSGGVASLPSLQSSESNVQGLSFICIPTAGATGDSGTWTVRVNVTTANMNLTITEVYICRHNSSGVFQEAIGSATGLSISLGTTGVKSQNVTGSAVTLAAGDLAVISISVSNGAMSTQTAAITRDQNIDSPFSAATSPNPNVNDSVTITESVTARLNPMLFNVFDAPAVTESVTMNVKNMPSVFDTVTAGESVTINLINMPSVFDGVTVSEAVTMNVIVMPNVFDSVLAAESVTVLLAQLRVSSGDDVSVTESVTVTLVDAAGTITISANDSVTLAESVTVYMLLPASSFDTVSVIDAPSMNVKLMPSVNDAVTAGEFVGLNVKLMPSVLDSVGVADVPTMHMLVYVSAFDGISVAEDTQVSIFTTSAIQVSAADDVFVADEGTILLPWLTILSFDDIQVVDVVSVTETGEPELIGGHFGKKKRKDYEPREEEKVRVTLDRVISEYYGEIVNSDLPLSAKEEAAEAVKPYTSAYGIPQVSQVDWNALNNSLDAVSRILSIWQAEVLAQHDDEETLFMMAQ